ncbi:MAG: T9SS type A sorting domain-containing protein [Bacteroidetes bacterium]|nr:T9SS type A sorting domain-containing protein [Bacteroidota bacterium]
MKKLLLLIFCLFYSLFVKAQLSGTYTIGGTSPDYPNITSAVSSLSSAGLSGPVIFNIRDGVYNEQIDIWFPITPSNTITFQSESGDSSAVTISCNSLANTVFLGGGQTFYFKNLTIKNLTGVGTAIDMSSGKLYVENCKLSAAYYAISSNASLINVINSTLIGKTSIGYASAGAIIKNNIIHTLVGTPSLRVSYSPGVQIINNEFNNGAFISFCNNCKYIGNKSFNTFSIGSSDYSQISNNFFYNYVQFWSNNCNIYNNNFAVNNLLDCQSYYGVYKNNNFPKSFYFNYGFSTDTFINNNYSEPTTGWWDTNPYYFDPQYVDSTDLHAQNSHLVGFGLHIPTVLFDIDSVSRQFFPSIGANEICISTDSVNLSCADSVSLVLCNFINNLNVVWSPTTGLSDATISNPKASPNVSTVYYGTDTISGIIDSIKIKVVPFQVIANNDTLLKCGDSIMLNATFNSGVTYIWSPSVGLSNPNIQRPWAKPYNNITYTVTAINPLCGNTIDSVKITIDSLPRANYALSSITGLTVVFNNQSSCADTYSWDFGDGGNSTLYNPSHTYGSSGLYVITLIACNSWGCDTVAYYLNVSNTGVIENNNVNSFTISPNPSNGQFELSFEQPLADDKTIEISDLLGSIVFTEKLMHFSGSYRKQIDLTSLNKGIYIIELKGNNTNSTKKILFN